MDNQTRERIEERIGDIQHQYWNELTGTRFHSAETDAKTLDMLSLVDFFEDIIVWKTQHDLA